MRMILKYTNVKCKINDSIELSSMDEMMSVSVHGSGYGCCGGR